MELNYHQARSLEGKIIQYKNERGEWSVAKVVKVKEDGLELAELNAPSSKDGFGYGFCGPRPFFGRPFFVPFIGFGFVAPLWF